MPTYTDGNDSIFWRQPGAEQFFLLGGNDRLTINVRFSSGSSDSGDFISAGSGNDYVTAANTADIILGEDGDDNLNGQGGDDTVDGGAGNDNMLGGDGDDLMFGGSGADRLTGGRGNDLMDGGEGNDTLNGSGGNDTIDGGDGDDVIVGGSGDSNGDAIGSTGGDLIVGILNGGAGNDSISGGNQNEVFEERISNIAIGPAFDESLIDRGLGNDSIFAAGGDDIIFGGLGSDTIDGGNGFDIVDHVYQTSAVYINLADQSLNNGAAEGDLYSAIERFFGSNYNDLLVGDASSNQFAGRDGNDAMIGGAGDDTLLGGAGNDVFVGGAGADFHNGGSDVDTVDFRDSANAIAVTLSDRPDLPTTGSGGDAEGDQFIFVEEVLGSANADSLRAEGNGRTLQGGAGDDVLHSAGILNDLVGGVGADRFEIAPGPEGNATIVRDYQFDGTEVIAHAGVLARDPGGDPIYDLVPPGFFPFSGNSFLAIFEVDGGFGAGATDILVDTQTADMALAATRAQQIIFEDLVLS